MQAMGGKMTDDKVAGDGPYTSGDRVDGHLVCPGDEDVVNAAYAEGRASRDGLRTALKGLLEDNLDYARINHLGGVENKHWLKAARAALRADEERN